ncbi:MAG: response regulator [Anaerolineae bacterium]|nr:response regulator [Anaerolineae bacterium]
MPSREQFLRQLREDLAHLYEPRRLRRSPLAALFGVADRFDTASALQRILIEAIQSLEPAGDEPSRSRAWEIYEPLYYRYVEQIGQEAVAAQMRMSVRHLRRKEQDALEVLADLLWARFDLGSAPAQDAAAGVVDAVEDGATVSEALSWLRESAQPGYTDLNQALPAVLELARRLAGEHHVCLETDVAEGLPSVPADPVAFRQCLLSLLSVVIPRARGGKVLFSGRPLRWEVDLRVQCTGYPSGPKPALGDEAASLNVAEELARLCRGRLALSADARAFDATVTLPAVEQLPVLVIDDNADTLQLLQRYTLGTRYRFVGTRDPAQAVALVEECSPQIIVLDVMMPRLDGWEMLDRLRQHPVTAHIPIVVCTVLPQKEMARLLGASAFLKKPVTRQAFLDALDQQVERLAKGPR